MEKFRSFKSCLQSEESSANSFNSSSNFYIRVETFCNPAFMISMLPYSLAREINGMVFSCLPHPSTTAITTFSHVCEIPVMNRPSIIFDLFQDCTNNCCWLLSGEIFGSSLKSGRPRLISHHLRGRPIVYLATSRRTNRPKTTT